MPDEPSDAGAEDTSIWDAWSCFAAGTLINTPTGPIAIEELTTGDRVLAFDERTGTQVVSTVTQTFVHGESIVRPLSTSNGRTLWVTDEHPIYVPSLGEYVDARFVGNQADLLSSTAHGVERVNVHSWGAPLAVADVYNIEVAAHHNYFAEGILVHNKTDVGGPDRDGGLPDGDTSDVNPGDADQLDADPDDVIQLDADPDDAVTPDAGRFDAYPPDADQPDADDPRDARLRITRHDLLA